MQIWTLDAIPLCLVQKYSKIIQNSFKNQLRESLWISLHLFLISAEVKRHGNSPKSMHFFFKKSIKQDYILYIFEANLTLEAESRDQKKMQISVVICTPLRPAVGLPSRLHDLRQVLLQGALPAPAPVGRLRRARGAAQRTQHDHRLQQRAGKGVVRGAGSRSRGLASERSRDEPS